jgi:hypothetical protein
MLTLTLLNPVVPVFLNSTMALASVEPETLAGARTVLIVNPATVPLVMMVGSVAVAGVATPPPETETVFVTLPDALTATSTCSVMTG